MANRKSSSISSVNISGASPVLPLALGVLASIDDFEESDILLDVSGEEDPGEDSSEDGAHLEVLHADRDASGLLDTERRMKLVPGVLGFDVLGLISGKLSADTGGKVVCLSIIMEDAEGGDKLVLILSGLAQNPASVGSGRKRGET
jgi:hypothetical protein